jgi:hypothetical protein
MAQHPVREGDPAVLAWVRREWVTHGSEVVVVDIFERSEDLLFVDV